jgi:hypothetical protein
MATFVQTAAQLFSGGTKLTCYSDSIGLELTADAVEFTTYCSNGIREYRQGLKSWTATGEGFHDFAAGSTVADPLVPGEEFTPTALTTGTNLTVCPVDGTEGAVTYLAEAAYTSLSPLVGGAVGEAAKYGFTAMPYGSGRRMLRGVLEANRTVTSSSSTTGSNTLGAVATGARVGASLHVLSLAGTSPSITVKIQSDDNSGFSSPTDRITFAAATTRSGQFGVLAGPVTDTYWRATYTVSGTGPSIAFAVSIGIA